ncbi:DUF2254 domain-containing protein [Natronoflexus pectinivorans]|uniref:Putative membrane protein n=1 Tax=Natronoflexus pectinivorans TaxID=682526 RepID=A0A4R2GNZ1_9BACT|nr:DUF2254 domain-containing protein [Natronoflexus pectinivorans]TCO11064.1 putative membrane protein [Natronoflexus pectinivorans]
MKKFQYLWEDLNSSFWFIPVMMLMLASGSAMGLIYLDSQTSYTPDGVLKYLLPASIDSARSILVIIGGAMIGVAGTVFSITLVVLTLASSQLGSRLVRNFMYDKLNQVVLGTYVSSFVYCLIVLTSIKDSTDFNFVPAISVLVALVSAMIGIILLVVFIHHVSMSIQSDKVISDISESMSKSIKKLFPDEIGLEEENAIPDINALKTEYAYKQKITNSKSGYLQSIDGQGLMNLAVNNDCVIVLRFRPGNFLTQGMVLCEVFCNEECSKNLHEKIQNDFILGKVRTPLQDAEFSIHQMVEVAARALSPGVNDPYTAIACIDNLTSIMCYLAGAEFPSPYRYDSQGKLRIVADTHTFSGMLNTAFNQIRQYGEGSPAVLIRLMEAMLTISTFTRNKNQQKLINLHAKMIMNAAKNSFSEKHDLKNMKDRYKTLKHKNLPNAEQ